jgi:hypothetical protein
MKLSQLRTTIEKTEEGKKLIQNKCVSSQNKQYEKRRGRYGRRLSAILSPYLSSAGCLVRRLSGRTGSVSTETFDFTGRPHKIPQMSYLRRESKRRRFLVI